MAHADFVHLRVHSAYSLSEGAIRLKELVALCQNHAMPAVAVTDTGNLFGALEFALLAKDSGVQPIIGTILGLSRGDGDGNHRLAGTPPPDHVLLLVQSKAGYRNLLALVSRAFLETEHGRPPQVDLCLLEHHADGLIALTGGPTGPIGRLLAEGKPGEAEAALKRLRHIFSDRLYVELMRLDFGLENRIEGPLIELAYRLELPLVATNDVYFADPTLHTAHDALLCIADGTYVSDPERRRVTPEHHFKSAESMRSLFADIPEAVDNTLVIARRCHFMPTRRPPILPHFETGSGRGEADELRAQAAEGLARRLAGQLAHGHADTKPRDEIIRPYHERLEFELEVIITMGFAGYFLIVADFIKWAKSRGIPVGPGRGSGAASVVAWSLTITDLDPLRFGLIFERFLNPERVSMPDFDIDFCQDRRDEVIDYVRGKYGDDRVAQIITFGKLQARAVLRDVGRVLQLPYGQVDRICKLVPNNPASPVTLKQALDTIDQLREEREQDATVRGMIDIALKLEGLYRHASTHAAGVVIGDRPLQELIPLYRDPRSSMPVTQFSMKYVEQAGLVKFDFLGLKTLTVIDRTLQLLRETGRSLSPEAIPLDDHRTFAMLSRAETVGVFQLESAGMRDVLKRLKPNRFEDIIALVALYRPGPMDNIPTYIATKNGEAAPDYLHPTLEPILTETFGIMIYQEQVMQVAQVLAGYSPGEADLLRRAMGKKIQSEMDAQKRIFVDGAVGRGVEPEKAAHIFDLVNKFAGYGFNKAHAACYALIAYQTAYLKCNYPVEFLAASMNLDIAHTEKLDVFRQEAARLGTRMLRPDINRSRAEFGVEEEPDGGLAIRYALGAIKGVGIEAMRTLVAERAANGPFASVLDLARRLDGRVVNKRQLEGLIRAGALDGLDGRRAALIAAVDTIMRHAHAAAADRASQQTSLFPGGVGDTVEALSLPPVAEWNALERLREEHEAIGFYLSAHPMANFNVGKLGARSFAEVEDAAGRGQGGRVKMAGVVTGRRERVSKTGKRFAFLSLSDMTGVFDVTVFSEVLAAAKAFLEENMAVLLDVEVQIQGEGGYRLTANGIEPLESAMARLGTTLEIRVGQEESVEAVRRELARGGPGRSRVSLLVPWRPGHDIEVALPERYALTAEARASVMAAAGILDVREA